jgi:penicillin-insensitive murein DD-endopeptidase
MSRPACAAFGAGALLGVTVLCSASCFGPGLLTDGTSVSFGSAAEGALRDGSRLPVDGDGWEVPPSWRHRQANYGTDELVDALVRAGRRLAREHAGSRVQYGDISPRGGGGSARHRSHQNGRDVDIFLFGADEKGKPLGPLDAMVPFGADGRSKSWKDGDGNTRVAWGRRFDDARNWATVRALLTDPGVEVQWIFLHDALIKRLLAWAAEKNEDPELVARAAAVLAQPARALPHDDHMHLRVYCDPADVPFGCVDRGPVRWVKKHQKYLGTRALADESGLVGRGGAKLPALLRWLAVSPSTWRW